MKTIYFMTDSNPNDKEAALNTVAGLLGKAETFIESNKDDLSKAGEVLTKEYRETVHGKTDPKFSDSDSKQHANTHGHHEKKSAIRKITETLTNEFQTVKPLINKSKQLYNTVEYWADMIDGVQKIVMVGVVGGAIYGGYQVFAK
jgi:hypothetical protein